MPSLDTEDGQISQEPFFSLTLSLVCASSVRILLKKHTGCCIVSLFFKSTHLYAFFKLQCTHCPNDSTTRVCTSEMYAFFLVSFQNVHASSNALSVFHGTTPEILLIFVHKIHGVHQHFLVLQTGGKQIEQIYYTSRIDTLVSSWFSSPMLPDREIPHQIQ